MKTYSTFEKDLRVAYRTNDTATGEGVSDDFGVDSCQSIDDLKRNISPQCKSFYSDRSNECALVSLALFV